MIYCMLIIQIMDALVSHVPAVASISLLTTYICIHTNFTHIQTIPKKKDTDSLFPMFGFILRYSNCHTAVTGAVICSSLVYNVGRRLGSA